MASAYQSRLLRRLLPQFVLPAIRKLPHVMLPVGLHRDVASKHLVEVKFFKLLEEIAGK